MQVNLVGVKFRPAEAREIVAALEEGDSVYLEREPENEFDSNAIKVLDMATDMFIGYVDKDNAALLAPQMDDDIEFDVTVHSRQAAHRLILDVEEIEADDEDDAA